MAGAAPLPPRDLLRRATSRSAWIETRMPFGA